MITDNGEVIPKNIQRTGNGNEPKRAALNLRKWLLFSLVGLRGQRLGQYYERYLNEYQTGVPRDFTQKALVSLLSHCEQNVPYYSSLIKKLDRSYISDPINYLNNFPILTRDTLRDQFENLKSNDLVRRRWYLNSTGGSTGEPAIFIQDWDYASRSGAIKLLYSTLVGKDIGEKEVRLWGNIRDIRKSSEGWRASLLNSIENVVFINSIYLTPETIVDTISLLNKWKPKLIVSYVEPIYELAKYAERENIKIQPQSVIMTSASKLYPFMREKIEYVFQCKVFDRYGSREFGDIACEQPGINGLWVAPWGNYIEIVDSNGKRVPDGVEGDILVTSLNNYAMPLIRYKINDRGRLGNGANSLDSHGGQILTEVIGRSIEFFKTKENVLINSGYFMAKLYFRGWISKYQIVQKNFSNIVYRIVKFSDPSQSELDNIVEITKNVMGNDCNVAFEFVDDISPSGSGKYEFLISEVHD